MQRLDLNASGHGTATGKSKERARERVLEHDRAITGDIYQTSHALFDNELYNSLVATYGSVRPSTDMVGWLLTTFYSPEVRARIEQVVDSRISFRDAIDVLSAEGLAIHEILFIFSFYKYAAFPRADTPTGY
jgi:hypothetical protein